MFRRRFGAGFAALGHRRGKARRPPPGGLRAWGRTTRRGPEHSSTSKAGICPTGCGGFPRSRSSRLRGGGDPAHPRSSRVTIRTGERLAEDGNSAPDAKPATASESAFPPGSVARMRHRGKAGDDRVPARGDRIVRRGDRGPVSRGGQSARGLRGADRHRPAPRSAPAEPSRRDPRPPGDVADQGRREDAPSSRTGSSSSPRRTSSSRSSITSCASDPPGPAPSRRRSTCCSRRPRRPMARG